MSAFLKLDVHYVKSDRVADLSFEAKAIDIAVMCECKAQLRDGQLPRRQVDVVAFEWGLDLALVAGIVGELVAAGRWALPDERTIEIVGWLDRNESRAEVESKRSWDAKRKRQERAKKAPDKPVQETSERTTLDASEPSENVPPVEVEVETEVDKPPLTPPLGGTSPSAEAVIGAAIADALDWDPEAITDTNDRRLRKAACQLTKVGATPQAVADAATRWNSVAYGELTPAALARRWTDLHPKPVTDEELAAIVAERIPA